MYFNNRNERRIIENQLSFFSKGEVMKNKIYFILSLLLTLSITFQTFAASSTKTLDFGGIDISIETYMLDENGKKMDINYKTLFPGQRESFVIEVSNNLDSSWVRVKVVSEINGKPIDIDIVDSLQNGWIKCGGYYYLTAPLDHSESSIMTEHIMLPEEILGMDDNISIKAYAEAIQRDGFVPDFSSVDPFNGILIESTNLNKNHWEEAQTKGDGHIETIFDNRLNSVISNKSLFEDIGCKVLLPGHNISDSFIVTNNSSNIIKIRMTTLEKNQLDIPELRKIKLEIKKDGAIIYDNSLINPVLNNGIYLGTFGKNAKSKIEFRISIPKEVTNDLATQELGQKWMFDVEELKNKDIVTSDNSNNAIDNIVYENPDPSLKKGIDGGKWELIDEQKHLWKYQFSNGDFAKDGWIYVRNPYYNNLSEYSWYHFDANRYMTFGWIKSKNDNWYYGHSISDGDLGTLVYGWHYDLDDNRTYYLDPISGIMQSGWQLINGKYYYFAKIEDTYKQNWFWNTLIGRWIYDMLGDRPYGSMYVNERTPGNYMVNDKGEWEDIK